MQLFLPGVVLPFRKGKVPEQIEDLTVSQVRVPLASADADSPIAHLSADVPVACGSEICRDGDFPIVSTVSGAIEGTVVINHPVYGALQCADILAAGEEEERLPVVPEEELTPELILQIAREAAIYDELDGVPLWEKLQQWVQPADAPPITDAVLVADATENDIFGTAAWAVVATQPKLVLFGLQMAAKAIRFSRYHIATLLPKRRRRTLKRAIGRMNVYTVGDEYPVTMFAPDELEVYRIGAQACLALGRALKQGLRHTAAIVTVSGDALPAPRTLRVPFGTRVGDLIEACQPKAGYSIVLGDAMVGVPCTDPGAPILPGITTVLAMLPRRVRTPGPCIGCGRCAEVCHVGLLPYEIVRRNENMHYERLQHLSPEDCDGCGACSYICPAGRPVAVEVLRAGQTKGTVFLAWGEDDYE